MAYSDLTGMKFGRLTVLRRAENDKWGFVRWLCVCDCGNEVCTSGASLRSGHTQSCGCLRRERIVDSTTKHNGSHTKLYTIWQGMKRRCFNKNHKHYHLYGGRGITVHSEWIDNFGAFRDWAMSAGYTDGLTLDRIDVNGNYEPSNCRWITMHDQARNKSTNVIVSYHGEEGCLTDMCRKLNISKAIARHRMKNHGVTFEQAVDDYDTRPPFVDYSERAKG